MSQIKRTTKKKEILNLATIKCEKCTHCCEYGSGIVLSEEIKEIAKKHGTTEEEFKIKYLEPHIKFNTKHYRFKTIKKNNMPYGKCIFLKDNGCKIHDIKPLHCRVGTCNEHGEDINIWFAINHFVNKYDPESIRQWNTYIKLGNKTIAQSELKDLVSDEEKLKEILDYKILR